MLKAIRNLAQFSSESIFCDIALISFYRAINFCVTDSLILLCIKLEKKQKLTKTHMFRKIKISTQSCRFFTKSVSENQFRSAYHLFYALCIRIWIDINVPTFNQVPICRFLTSRRWQFVDLPLSFPKESLYHPYLYQYMEVQKTFLRI